MSEEPETRARRRARWMREAQDGDAAAYRALLDDVGPDVARFLRAHLPAAQDVDDVYQETLLALHRARHTYEPERPVEPWLFAIANHVAARHMQRRRTRMAREMLVDVLPEQSIDHGGDARLDWAEAFHRLSPTQREALELVKLRGFSTERAA